MSHATSSLVVDVHVEHIVTSKHTVGGLEGPVVGVRTVNWHHTLENLVIQTRKRVRLTQGDINGFHVEDHTLDVV